MQFTPVRTERPWGSENWLLADLGYIDSEVRGGWLDGNTLSELMETYLEKVVGDDAFEYYGLQFPVTVKEILFDGKTPVFVHPDDEVAAQRYDSLGKVAVWKVLSAGEDARILLGLKNPVTAEEFYRKAQQGELESLMNVVPVRSGDTFLLPPGVLYAFEGKARVVEVSEASSLVFDLSDSEDLVEAFDFISLDAYAIPSGFGGPTAHFRLSDNLTPGEGDAQFVLHLSPSGDRLTLYPAEGDKGSFPGEGLFIFPGEFPRGED